MNHDKAEKLARAWDILVRQAQAPSLDEAKINYGDFVREVLQKTESEEISAQVAGNYLYPIQDICREEERPPLTGLVVGKSSRVPSSGFAGSGSIPYEEEMDLVRSYDWERVPHPYLMSDGSTLVDTDAIIQDLLNNPGGSPKFARVPSRGQRQVLFRDALLEAYGGTCAICGLSEPILLEAAHIKDWAVCEGEEATTVRNGLLLCRNHHKAFDAGLWTLSDDFAVVKLRKSLGTFGDTLTEFASPKQSQHAPGPEFLAWHREVWRKRWSYANWRN